MEERKLVYFASDVHLGLNVKNPDEREKRFVLFLNSIPSNAMALYLLGDIWDFWYEYRDVVPKGYIRVFAALQRLMDNGVEVFFFQGNHDVWTYHYFEELGMKRLVQPYLVDINGKVFCLGHGDGLGPVPRSYLLMRSVFFSKVAQSVFSLLHPWIAFRLGNGWSKHNRLSRNETYVFKGDKEPIVQFAQDYSAEHKVDYFIFGHYHTEVHMRLKTGSEFFIMDSWLEKSPYLYFDGISILGASSQNIE